jgi:hypothetical protein
VYPAAATKIEKCVSTNGRDDDWGGNWDRDTYGSRNSLQDSKHVRRQRIHYHHCYQFAKSLPTINDGAAAAASYSGIDEPYRPSSDTEQRERGGLTQLSNVTITAAT